MLVLRLPWSRIHTRWILSQLDSSSKGWSSDPWVSWPKYYTLSQRHFIMLWICSLPIPPPQIGSGLLACEISNLYLSYNCFSAYFAFDSWYNLMISTWIILFFSALVTFSYGKFKLCWNGLVHLYSCHADWQNSCISADQVVLMT